MARRSLVHVALIVADYDEAISFYTNVLGFDLIEDTYIAEQDKRWVLVSPSGTSGAALLLAMAADERQQSFVGNQSGGRVFLFLATDDFWRDYDRLVTNNVKIVREPATYDYGIVAVFEDLYGHRWDLIQHADGHPYSMSDAKH